MKRRGLCGLLSVAMAAGTMAANYIPAAADELEPVTLHFIFYGDKKSATDEVWDAIAD